MGQNLSCTVGLDQELVAAIEQGDLELVEAILDREPRQMRDKLSPLHYAASSGQTNVISLLLDRGVHPDVLNRHRQTPLMVAAMHGKPSCIERLLQAGANVCENGESFILGENLEDHDELNSFPFCFTGVNN